MVMLDPLSEGTRLFFIYKTVCFAKEKYLVTMSFFLKKISLYVRTEPETEKRGAEGPGRESDFGVFRFVSFISRIVPCAGLTPPPKRKFKIRKNNTARFLDNSDEIKFLGLHLIQFSRNCLVGYWG